MGREKKVGELNPNQPSPSIEETDGGGEGIQAGAGGEEFFDYPWGHNAGKKSSGLRERKKERPIVPGEKRGGVTTPGQNPHALVDKVQLSTPGYDSGKVDMKAKNTLKIILPDKTGKQEV